MYLHSFKLSCASGSSSSERRQLSSASSSPVTLPRRGLSSWAWSQLPTARSHACAALGREMRRTRGGAKLAHCSTPLEYYTLWTALARLKNQASRPRALYRCTEGQLRGTSKEGRPFRGGSRPESCNRRMQGVQRQSDVAPIARGSTAAVAFIELLSPL